MINFDSGLFEIIRIAKMNFFPINQKTYFFLTTGLSAVPTVSSVEAKKERKKKRIIPSNEGTRKVILYRNAKANYLPHISVHNLADVRAK